MKIIKLELWRPGGPLLWQQVLDTDGILPRLRVLEGGEVEVGIHLISPPVEIVITTEDEE